jgi:hypothetical protein
MVMRVGFRPPGKAKKRAVAPGGRRDTSDEVLIPDSRMKLPHERDETPNARRTSNPVTRQAYRDASGTNKDTDVRGTAMQKFRSATGTRAVTGTPPLRKKPARRSSGS